MTYEHQTRPALGKGTAAISDWIRRCAAAWQPILVTALVIGSLGLAGGTYFFRYEPDSQIGDAAAQQAVRAATEGAVAMLSYSPESLADDFARAKSHLTGDLLAYYTKFTEETVGPTAKEKRMWASAKVIRAAVAEMRQDSAVVLMFVNQSTETKEKPHPTVTESNFLVTMARIDGSWLIAKFDPL